MPGSICETVPSRLLVTQTKPPPSATPAGPSPTWIVCTCAPVSGSSRDSEPLSAFATHTPLSSAAIAPGEVPTAVCPSGRPLAALEQADRVGGDGRRGFRRSRPAPGQRHDRGDRAARDEHDGRRHQPTVEMSTPRAGLQQRELGLQPLGVHLPDPLRPINILQPVHAEIAQRHTSRQVVLHQHARRVRKQHLAAVSDRTHPRRPMHREADVALACGGRLAGVDPDPYPNLHPVRPGLGGERPLDRDRRRDRVRGAAEGHEERIALSVDLVAVVRRERLPQQHLVSSEQIAVPLAPDLPEQRRRPFDVREQEGDGAAQTVRREPPLGMVCRDDDVDRRS